MRLIRVSLLTIAAAVVCLIPLSLKGVPIARVCWFLDGAVLEAPEAGRYEACNGQECGGSYSAHIDITTEFKLAETNEYLGADTQSWWGIGYFPQSVETPSENEVTLDTAGKALVGTAVQQASKNIATNTAGQVLSLTPLAESTVLDTVTSWAGSAASWLLGKSAVA